VFPIAGTPGVSRSDIPQQGAAQFSLCAQDHPPGFIFQNFDLNDQIGTRDEANGFFRPLCQFETGARENVAKAGVVRLMRILEAVEVEMPDLQSGQFIRLHDGVGRALDAAVHAERPQQVTGQGGLAGAQIAAQLDEGIAQGRLRGKLGSKDLGRGFTRPVQGFYNGRVSQFIHHVNASHWVSKIQAWGRELGFSQIGVAGVDLSSSEAGLSAWLAAGFHGDMAYMASHGAKRARPAQLVPGTVSVITARMDYLSARTPAGWQAIELERLKRPGEAVVSLYARGRDYHKVMRARLQKLAERMADELGPFGHRVFTDSAPVLEVELATRGGLGWRGKHTLLLQQEAGSMFFLGEIFADLALPASGPGRAHCGRCTACVEACPTKAIVAPYRLDARRCISYLTIEHAGAIPLEFRNLMGNRIYGCDDCQLMCPWNKFAQRSALPDFDERQGMAGAQLVTLFNWTEIEFLRFTEGSPIRRIGHERWLRNIAVALGNALRTSDDPALRNALGSRVNDPSLLVREHVVWALAG